MRFATKLATPEKLHNQVFLNTEQFNRYIKKTNLLSNNGNLKLVCVTIYRNGEMLTFNHQKDYNHSPLVQGLESHQNTAFYLDGRVLHLALTIS